ncbi:hypothetical protein BCR34DRAFT_572598 [Clohesyomyces aquaticus]|uniref:dihydroneopterin aldolase n=1 Tax=Clohesyomyces aquaticus TaxID=1231657 RepID=A0A1Y1Z2X7_9PLEO|nr:hypothetical protein BCR34DRAFT_572598 [Clohesyomyces aquaticus]
MRGLVRHAVYQAARADFLDSITVRNLEATVNAGVDAWGRKKEQRAHITAKITLDCTITSAAQCDGLDSSTVHYGKLSKDVRERVQQKGHEWVTTFALAKAIQESCVRTAGNTPTAKLEVDVFYPKGSLLGDGAGLIYGTSHPRDGSSSRVLYLRNVRVPCLIGINSNERLAKQSLIVNVWIECLAEDRSDDYAQLEQVVFQAISESSFKTLESLVTMVVDELREKFFRPELDDGAYIRLQVEKPMAVPSADAPAIEIVRKVKE